MIHFRVVEYVYLNHSGVILMEQVLERETTAGTKIDWRDIEMYYDDGRRIANPDTLKSIAEGQEIIAALGKAC